jgi:hypothetical protein
MSSADESIQRAKAHENARKILEGMRSPGKFNIFTMKPNESPIPTQRNEGTVGSIDIGGSQFGGPAPMDTGEPLPGQGADWLPGGAQTTGNVNPKMEMWKTDPMLRMKYGNDINAYLKSFQ